MTKIFDTVVFNDADTAIAGVAAQMLQVDLATIGANVTVTAPVTATEGQAFGVMLYSDTAGVTNLEVDGNALPVTLTFVGDCVLYTWDPFGYWTVVSQWREPQIRPFIKTQQVTPLGAGETYSPDVGELASIDLTDNGGNEIVSLVAAAATAQDGQVVGVQLVNSNDGSEVTFAGVTFPALKTTGDCVVFTWSASQVIWVPTSWSINGQDNALATYDSSGNLTPGDAALVAGPIDAYGRPQLWDYRADSGNGAVWRNGSWTVDGDPTNQTGEGYATYGPAGGTLDASNGMIGRVKYDRFQLRRIIGGVDIGSAFRVDPTSLYLTNDSAVKTAEIVRSTGNAYFGTVTSGGAAGSKWSSGTGTPEGVVTGNVGDLFSRTDGGAGTSLYVKESGTGNTGWLGK